jgi:hypothetical protein
MENKKLWKILRDSHKTKHGFIISHALNISNKE